MKTIHPAMPPVLGSTPLSLPTPSIENDCDANQDTIVLPWVSHYEPITWANGAHAAIHSILSALRYNDGAEYWLKEAIRQLAEARLELIGQNKS